MKSNWFITFMGLICFSLSACDYKPRNQGKALYTKHCASCHMENGQGLGALMPPLANADYVVINREELACLIRYGIDGPLEVNGVNYEGEMAGNRQLTDIEINNLIHFILVDLNGQKDAFVVAEVRKQLESCKD